MKITIVTQAYNAKKYIEQCITSVLNQTYTNLEYILIDNGSDDGTENIIREYAQRDSRIKYIRFEENMICVRWDKPILDKFATGEYFTVLDADDWLEPDYLERMILLAQQTDSDIVTTGSVMHFVAENCVSDRQSEKRLVLNKNEFAYAFPDYHGYFRAVWAKLIRMEIIKNSIVPTAEETNVAYGLDTLWCFAWLRNSNKICVDNSILHHYRVHPKSVSYQYDPRQSYSDIYLFNDSLDFLAPYGPISENNLLFLYVVYSNGVNDTLSNIKTSALTASEKSEEYYKILERQVTKDCYKRTYEDITNSKTSLFYEVFKTFGELDEIPQKWNEIFSFYFPKCCTAISIQLIKLAFTDKSMLNALINDNPESAVETVCFSISRNKYTKQFDLPQILCSLSQNHPILSNITDPKFLKNHSDVYLLLYQNKYADALSAMTDTLLKEKVNNETFLQTYLNVAALLEQVDEFIFGKVRTAEFYLSSKRFEECKEILDDLGEMGVEDNEEIIDMKAKLSEQLS